MASKNKITRIINIGILLLFLFSLQVTKAQTIYKMPSRPFGAIVVDYDLDGDNELIVGSREYGANDADSIVIMDNDGWGNFELHGFEANCDLFIYCEDMNNDNYPDIITRDGDSIFYYENDKSGGLGSAHFIGHTIGNRRIGGIADMDTNGYNDIVYHIRLPPDGWGIIYNEGDNNFNDDFFIPSATGAAIRTTTGDLNQDSVEDVLITSNMAEEGAYAMINELGSFNKIILKNDYTSCGFIANIDNYGANDIGLVEESSVVPIRTKVFPYRNYSLDFVPEGTAYLNGAGQLKSVEDFNLDGYPDLALTVSSWISDPSEDSIFIFRNNTNWGYVLSHKHYIGEYYLPSLFTGDLNMDGYSDIIVFGYLIPTVNHIQILWNDRNGGFVDTNNVYVSVAEQELKNNVQLYPNPTFGLLNIHSEKEFIVKIKIIDLNGRLLFEENNSIKSRSMLVYLNPLVNDSGLYACIVQLENNQIINKIIVLLKEGSYEKH